MAIRPLLTIALLLVLAAGSLAANADRIWPRHFNTDRARNAAERVAPILQEVFSQRGLEPGAHVFIRIFKKEAQLELFGRDANGQYHLLKTYPICHYSGDLGPKLKEGDGQSPEGFYFVNKSRLNPLSSFHLSFDIGFPNAYDRANNRTGSFLMVHGNCVSVGCYAMTDPAIEEIYTSVGNALENGQPIVRLHIFPFRMTDAAMDAHKEHPWHSFWVNLKHGYDYFESNGFPPDVTVVDRRYAFSSQP